MTKKTHSATRILLAAVCMAGVGPLLAAHAASNTAGAAPANPVSPARRARDPAQALTKALADPTAWPEQKLLAADGAGGDSFGYSVALSGTVAVVGALQATVNGHAAQGAAYIFTKIDGVWTQQQKLVASDGAQYDQFGKAVAIDGTTVLIGAQGASARAGAAYVFSATGGTWMQTQKLMSSDSAGNANFGGAVALKGSVAIVGEYNATVNGITQQGAAYVFTPTNGTWTQSQKLVASDGASDDQFGHAVALDGTTVAIGAWGATVNGNQSQGAVYLFSAAGGIWSETQKVIAGDGQAQDEFGRSIAVSGNELLVGAAYAAGGAGVVYAYRDDAAGWIQTQEFAASDSVSGDEFGYALAIDGSTALVGAIGVSSSNPDQGAAYTFVNANGSWSESNKLTASDGAHYDFFGYSVALNDADALVGAEAATVGGNAGQGAAYVYTRPADDRIFADGFDAP
ncbi:MAG: hypothetical protein ACHP7D_04035 [Lysobacterales bacterium]